MSGLREIKSKLVTNKSLTKIFSVMQLLAASKMNAALQLSRESNANLAEIRQMIARVFCLSNVGADEALGRVPRPKGSIGKNLSLVIASDRGLCGSYNLLVLRKFLSSKEIKAGGEIIAAIGNKVLSGLKRSHESLISKELSGSFASFLKDENKIDRLLEQILELYKNYEIDSCKVVFVYSASAISRSAITVDFLPINTDIIELENTKIFSEMEIEGADEKSVILEPSSRAVMTASCKLYLRTKLYSFFRTANYSELASRMMAMDSATRNSKELNLKLNRAYNKKRQAAITSDLIDIVNGSENT